MGRFSLNTFTLKFAIGTIWLVSVFLFSCGIYEKVFPFLEDLSNTSTWAILVSFPVIVFAYTVGEIITYLWSSSFLKKPSSFQEIDDFYTIAKINNEFLFKKYENMTNQYLFFKSCFPTFIFFGTSIVFSAIRVLKTDSNMKNISVAIGFIAIISSFLFIRITFKKKEEINYFLSNINKK